MLYSFNAAAQSVPKVSVGIPTAIEQLNPVTNFLADAAILNEYLYFSLLRTDKQSGSYLPLLAEDLPTLSADKLNYTYKIHPAAKFNSGKKVTAQDVVFSLKLLKNPWVNNAQSRIQYDLIASAEALNEHEVVIRLGKPSLEGIRLSSDFAILSEEIFDPQHLMAAVSIESLANPEKLTKTANAALKTVAGRVNPYGTYLESFTEGSSCGPYVVSEWKTGERILLSSNKQFWGRKLPAPPNAFFMQNVEQIEIRTLKSEDAVRNGMFDNSLDILIGLQPKLFFELRELPQLKPAYQFYTPSGSAYEYIGLNMQGRERGRKGIFDDPEVRRAFAHLVPTEWLLEKIRFSLGERIAADCSTPNPEFRNRELPLPDFNTQKAKQLLKEAGWEDHDGNGLLDKKMYGEEITFVVECLVNESRPYRAEIAATIQKMALEIGILVTYEVLPFPEYFGRIQRGDFDLYVGAWVSDPNEDSYRQIWHTKSWNGGFNFVGFGDDHTDRLVDEYDHSYDTDRRKEIAFEIQLLQSLIQPYVFLWMESNNLIIKKKFNLQDIGAYRPGFWIGGWK